MHLAQVVPGRITHGGTRRSPTEDQQTYHGAYYMNDLPSEYHNRSTLLITAALDNILRFFPIRSAGACPPPLGRQGRTPEAVACSGPYSLAAKRVQLGSPLLS